MSESKSALTRARHSALKMLTLREHSVRELLQKLISKGHDVALAEIVMSELETENLVSDGRFLEVFVRSKTERGFGPLRILQELQRHEINPALVESEINSTASFWIERAAQVRRKKFGEMLPDKYSDWARQVRFLQGPGYTMHQIQSLKKFDFEEELI